MAVNLPQTYKAAVFKKVNDKLTFEDVQLKEPEQGEVLIKVLATGVCHTDANVQAGYFGPLPRIPGHESIGTVVAVGPGEKRWKVGDRAGITWHGGHDGTCKACTRGQFQFCSNEQINGVTRDGGYAEYCLVRTEAVVAIPADVDPAAYCPLMCAGVTVFNSIRQLHIPPGETVAIQGLGGLGHLAIQYAAKMGYKVVALSSSGAKEKFAKDLGATSYIDGSKESHSEALSRDGGAALIVVTAPNPKIIGDLVNGLAVRGQLLILAPIGDITVDTNPMILKGLSVSAWASGHALDCEEAVEFAQLKGVNCMIEKFPFVQANEAFEHMLSGKARFRAVLTME
ncbi:MAG: hypothetical protein Q9167_004236 [Letrouitia subvulpina]